MIDLNENPVDLDAAEVVDLDQLIEDQRLVYAGRPEVAA